MVPAAAAVGSPPVVPVAPVVPVDPEPSEVPAGYPPPAVAPVPAAAKPTVASKGGWSIITLIVLLFVFYCLGGCLMNYKREGATGIDAIPHLEFWVTFPARCTDGCQRLVAMVRHRFSKTSQAQQRYEEVETMAYDDEL